MSSSTTPPRRRRGRVAITVLASLAAISGGQALAPTPAVALVDDGGYFCSGASWFEQVSGVSCFDKTETGGGLIGKPADNGAGALGTASPDPDCLIEGVYCVESTAPPCGQAGRVCVVVDGGPRPGRGRDRDSAPGTGEVKSRRGGIAKRSDKSRMKPGLTPKQLKKCGELRDEFLEQMRLINDIRNGRFGTTIDNRPEWRTFADKQEKQLRRVSEWVFKDNGCPPPPSNAKPA